MNQRTATQPSNINGGTAYKISSWWRQQPRIAAATLKEAGSNTSTNNEDATGRDDIETANSRNNDKNMQRKNPSITPTNHHHPTRSSRSKQRVSSRRHHRVSGIATSILVLAGLILLFSIAMFLGYNLHIIMNLDTPNELMGTAANLAHRNNPTNTFVQEEKTSSSSSSSALVTEQTDTDADLPKQTAEVEEVTENQYSSAVEVLDNKEIVGDKFEDQSELQHETLAVLVSGAGSSEVNGCYLLKGRYGNAWEFELDNSVTGRTFEMFKVDEESGWWNIQERVGNSHPNPVHYGVDGDSDAILPPTSGWGSARCIVAGG